MPDPGDRIEPGALWPLIVERSRAARACGALRPIETETHVLDDEGVAFHIRVVSSLTRKHAERPPVSPAPAAGPRPNPFLPYERDLLVAGLSETHVCLLNKYNVIDHHALIITRAFEPQESPLTLRDFDALCYCLAGFDALAFYNSGPVAGASQPHKHLQIVPLPLAADGPAIPIETLLPPTRISRAGLIERLPFRHVFADVDPARAIDRSVGPSHLHAIYTGLLKQLGFDPTASSLPAYNLLATRRFILIVPRSRERYETLSVNALGYAGSFFVPNRECLAVLQRARPMQVLREVAFPRTA